MKIIINMFYTFLGAFIYISFFIKLENEYVYFMLKYNLFVMVVILAIIIFYKRLFDVYILLKELSKNWEYQNGK